jgi:hypothetical protein
MRYCGLSIVHGINAITNNPPPQKKKKRQEEEPEDQHEKSERWVFSCLYL